MSDGHEDGAKPPGYRLMLREMAADERPREKLKLRGSAALSDGELLAILVTVTHGISLPSSSRREITYRNEPQPAYQYGRIAGATAARFVDTLFSYTGLPGQQRE